MRRAPCPARKPSLPPELVLFAAWALTVAGVHAQVSPPPSPGDDFASVTPVTSPQERYHLLC